MNNEPFEEQQDEQDPPAQPAEAGDGVNVEALKSERDALQDRLLRTAAEFDNYRKRIDRERRDQSESAASSLLVEILPVVDNLERALQAPSGPEAAGFRAGVGTTSGRRETAVQDRRESSNRAWVGYSRAGDNVDLSIERSAAKLRYSGSARVDRAINDSDRIGLSLTRLDAWRFGDFA